MDHVRQREHRNIGSGAADVEDDGLYRRILETVSDGVIVHRADGTIIAANRSILGCLGLDVGDILGCRWGELGARPVRLDGTPLSETDYPGHQALRTGDRTAETVIGAHHPDGGLRWLATVAEPLELRTSDVGDDGDDARRRWGAVCSFSDVTSELEAARLKSEFVSIVSHELRTPTACIRSAIGLISSALEGDVDARVSRLLDIADTNAIRLARLIDDILDIERIESGRSTLSLRQTGTLELVQRSVETTLPMAMSAGVNLMAADNLVDSWLWADADRVVQALVNLISNAVKFSPPDGNVVVSAGYDDGVATLSVADEGRGIPADMLDRVFERFEQVDASDSRSKGGTGLGLSICRSIVEQHNGEVSVTSEVGLGSTFTLSLPARSSLEDLQTDDENAGRATVVLCCPDPDWEPTQVLQSLFRQAGCSTARAIDVDSALRLARDSNAEALVLDLAGDGPSTGSEIARLSADPTAAEIPLVLVVRSQMTVDNTIEYTMRTKKVEPIFLVKKIVGFLEDALTDSTQERA